MSHKTIKTALVSVYHKDNLAPIIELLHKQGVKLLSTGGTQTFIESLGIPCTAVEDITGYPSIFGGRVKTLHPAVFGGILQRRNHGTDQQEAIAHNIGAIDLVIVDLYPFEATVASGAGHDDIIEKIDIGGISLIRAAAKNYDDCLIVSAQSQYAQLLEILQNGNGTTTLTERKLFAAYAFHISSHYDSAIFNYFNQEEKLPIFKTSVADGRTLRYGENPHQWGAYYGNLDELLEQLNGKELSYNNLVDVDAAINLIAEFKEIPGATFAIIKHTNACGVANASTAAKAYELALAADPLSAFGGVIITNATIDLATATLLNSLFFEILIAPAYDADALELLKSKKNRMLLLQKKNLHTEVVFKNLLNGVIAMAADNHTEVASELKSVTNRQPTDKEIESMLFAAKVCKHSKSNTIVLANGNQLIASGVGQTSRIDALEHAIAKAKHFGFSLEGAVMASDAFFPFPDCVEIAHIAGITAVIQPGGSVKDQDSIAYCNANNLAMVMTGIRHFKH
jgi:phosphoribosylaminoimidazolecarboxamide formyltransferase/IMP cyclohydrolase